MGPQSLTVESHNLNRNSDKVSEDWDWICCSILFQLESISVNYYINNNRLKRTKLEQFFYLEQYENPYLIPFGGFASNLG